MLPVTRGCCCCCCCHGGGARYGCRGDCEFHRDDGGGGGGGTLFCDPCVRPVIITIIVYYAVASLFFTIFFVIAISQFWSVTPIFSSKNWRPFFARHLDGVTPDLFDLSDLLCPLFFVNSATIFFHSGVIPLEGVTRGGPLRCSLVMPLVLCQAGSTRQVHKQNKTHSINKKISYQASTAAQQCLFDYIFRHVRHQYLYY